MCTLPANSEAGFSHELVKHTGVFYRRFPGEKAANLSVPGISGEPSRAGAACSTGPALTSTGGKLDESQKPSDTENTPNALHTPKIIFVQEEKKQTRLTATH